MTTTTKGTIMRHAFPVIAFITVWIIAGPLAALLILGAIMLTKKLMTNHPK
jgi:hypothetical protein